MTRFCRAKFLVAPSIAALTLCWGVQPAAAQQAAAREEGRSEDIVITAQRRETLLQETPLSVVAIDGGVLDDRQITSFVDLPRIAPGLTFSAGSSPRASGTAIRGIGTNTFSDAVEGAVGINIDGVPIGRQGAAFVEFSDIERIEVLRGPQGTLFGKNASAGVISILTQAPTAEWSGNGSFSYGSDNETKVKGSISGPLVGDALLGRLSVFASNRDGIIENADGRDLNNIDDWGARARFELDLGTTVTVGLITDYSERRPECCTWTTRRYGNGLFGSGVNAIRTAEQAAGIVAGPDNRRTALGAPQFTREESWGVAGTVDWSIGAHTISSITAYRDWHAIDNNDADRTPLALLDLNQGDLNQNQISQELRLTSPNNRRVEYVLGLFYFDQEVQNNSIQRGTLGLDLLGALPPGVNVSRRQFTQVDTQNIAVFGDGTLALTDQWKVIIGARYTEEELEINFRRDNLPGTLPFPGNTSFTCAPGLASATCVPATTDSAVSWRAGLQFQPADDINLYATASRGYKGQAFNSQIDSTRIRIVNAEVPTSYEAGARTSWYDGRLIANLTLFQTQFEDFQAQAAFVNPASGLLTFDIVNAGELETKGVEFEFTARPTDALTFSLNGAYTDATFSSFPQAPCYDSQTAAQGCVTLTGGARVQDLTGKSLPNAPEWTVTGSASYDFAVGEWTGAAAGSLFYRGDAVTALSNDPATVQEAYSLLDLSLAFTSPDDVFTVTLFGKNVTDEAYVESIFGTPFDTFGYSQFVATNARRTIGVSFGARF